MTESRHGDAKRTLWDLASRLAEAGEPEYSKLACLVHFAWEEAYELEQRANEALPPALSEQDA